MSRSLVYSCRWECSDSLIVGTEGWVNRRSAVGSQAPCPVYRIEMTLATRALDVAISETDRALPSADRLIADSCRWWDSGVAEQDSRESLEDIRIWLCGLGTTAMFNHSQLI